MENNLNSVPALNVEELQLFDLVEVSRVKEFAFGKCESWLMSRLFQQNGVVIINLTWLLLGRGLVLATFSKVSREGECVVKNRQNNAISGKEVRLLLGSHRIS